MTRFVVGDDRSQSTLFPERLDDYLGEDNPVRAIDVFVDELDLAKLGFGGVEPEATGRPAYHPATLLKIYVYGYLNRVQSSRRLERECQRNIELVWLTGRLMPDFKTIADFRKDNGEAIRKVCREFVVLCRRLELFNEASVAIDGSKFKAVNTRDRNFTQAKMQRRLAQIDESIARYLSQLDSADRQGEAVPEAKITRLNEKIATLREEIQRLNGLNTQMMQTEDKQISLTDPDARSMATSGRGSGMVGYNVQSAVDTKHHLIVTHEVTNVGSDRSQLSRMSEQARAAIGSEAIEAVADRGYYSGEEIVACEQAGVTVYLPKPITSVSIGVQPNDRQYVAVPNKTWITLISVFCSRRCVAKLCRRVCGDTCLPIAAIWAAVSQARLSWRADIGLTGFIPGNSHPCGRAALHQARNSSSRCGESIT